MTVKHANTQQRSGVESVAIARSSPGGLALAADPRFRYPRHVEYLDDIIVRTIAGELPPRLLIEEPPRHGKSELVSKWLPAWHLGNFPDHRVALASYEGDFAATWGRGVRDILEDVGGAIFGVGTAEDSRARNRWDLRRVGSSGPPLHGGMIAVGVGGPLTGKGANLLVIDDPIKNQVEAESAARRKLIWKWWQSVAYTRLEPGAIAIVMMTRWHEDDLAGRLIADAAEGGEEWNVVRLPAIAEDNDPIGRDPGEALWPERYPVAALKQIRRSVGPKVWDALYQQRPSRADSGEFESGWWRYYRPYGWPRAGEVMQSWDCSFKGKDDSDFVVGQLWRRHGADAYLLAQIRGRMTFTETLKAMAAMTRFAGSQGLGVDHRKLIEDAANGPAVIDTLRKKITGLVAVGTKGESKLARARAVVPQIEAGNVHIPKGAIPAPRSPKRSSGELLWTPTRTVDFTAEAEGFPAGVNDDQVDAMSQYLARGTHTVEATRYFEGDAPPSDNADLLEVEW